MYSTPLSEALAAVPRLGDVERARLLSDPALSELSAVFAAIRDPRAASAFRRC